MARELIEGTWDYQQAAKYLGCTKGTLQVWVSQRRVPHLKLGRLTRFLKRDLDEHLEKIRVPIGY